MRGTRAAGGTGHARNRLARHRARPSLVTAGAELTWPLRRPSSSRETTAAACLSRSARRGLRPGRARDRGQYLLDRRRGRAVRATRLPGGGDARAAAMSFAEQVALLAFEQEGADLETDRT